MTIMAETIQYELGDYFTVEKQLLADSIFVGLTESDLLSFTDSNGISNLDRIYLKYSAETQEELKSEYESQKLLIKSGGVVSWPYNYEDGTIILVESNKVNLTESARTGGEQIVKEGNSVTGTVNINAFIDSRLSSMINNESAKKSEYVLKYKSGETTRKSHPNARVYMWIRSLSRDSDNELQGSWLNISRHLLSIDTSTDSNGGNFQLSLSNVNAYYDENLKSWKLSKDITNQSSFKGNLDRNNFFFHTAINKNDLVLIKYDSTTDEKDILDESSDDFLYLGDFDMIALVDSASESTSSNNEVAININGRDLSKLLIDDGNYMYPLLFTEQQWVHKESPVVKRNAFTNAYDFYSIWRYNSLRDSIQFIINVLSNIRVVPDSAVQHIGVSKPIKSYKESVDPVQWEKAQLYNEAGFQNLKKELEVNTDNVGLLVNKEANEQILFDVARNLISFTYDYTLKDGNISIVYDDFASLVDSQLSVPGDNILVTKTSGELTVTAPNNLCDAVINYYIYNKLSKNIPPKKTIVNKRGGIWSLVDLAFDEQIANRRVADTSLGQPDSSLLNLIWNYAQYPFIEFFMDTYGSSFTLVFRRPPLDSVAINDFISSGLLAKLEIEEGDVLNENLAFDETVYSLYELDYKSVNLGGDSSLWGFIPAVPLAEIAEIYGNQRLKITSNLICVNDTKGKEYFPMLSELRSQAYNDLKFVIDINSYLPFTRKGTITIDGDRRFKKGTWMHYKPTNEIFYIDGVSNSYTISENDIDRTTTLQVSRGMVLKYVTGEETLIIDGKNVPLTYFNIVDTQKIVNFFKEKFAENDKDKVVIDKQTENVFKVNKPILNFFFKRKQFVK